MFNTHTHTQYMNESINFIVNGNQTEVNPHEDEDFDLTWYNVNQVVAESIGNNVWYVEEDGYSDDGEDNSTEGKEPLTRINKNHPIENIIGDQDEGFATWIKDLE